MPTIIVYQHADDADFILTLGWTTLGLALNALAFTLGYGVEIGQILALAG